MMFALVVATIVALFSAATAFDTGPHTDATASILAAAPFRYSRDAVDTATLGNWFTDVFAFTPGALQQNSIPELKQSHDDNVIDLALALRYWTRLADNAHRAVVAVARNGSVTDFVLLTGTVLHTVQDFYAHTNWADMVPRGACDCLPTQTFTDTVLRANGSLAALLQQSPALGALISYSYGKQCSVYERNCLPGQIEHGYTCTGQNRDAYDRPRWTGAYAAALADTWRWAVAIHAWARDINPTMVDAVQNYTTSPEDKLVDLTRLKFEVSATTEVPGAGDNGHWKGAGSGDTTRFASSSTSFINTKSPLKSVYLQDKLYANLTAPILYDPIDNNPGLWNATSTDIVSGLPQFFTSNTTDSLPQLRVVQVLTLGVKASRPGRTSHPDTYATIDTVDPATNVAIQFIESPQNADEFTPHWTTWRLVPANATSLQLTYTLRDTDGGVYDMGAGGPQGAALVTYYLNNASLHNTTSGAALSNPATFATPDNKTFVQIQVSDLAYGGGACSGPISGRYNPWCPNIRYYQIGLHSFCGAPTDEQLKNATDYLYFANPPPAVSRVFSAARPPLTSANGDGSQTSHGNPSTRSPWGIVTTATVAALGCAMLGML